MRILIGIGFLIIGTKCLAFGSPDHSSVSVSLARLIASPDQYHEKIVRVIGVGRVEFEGNSICLTKEHHKYRVSKNCLWISVDYDKLEVTEAELKAFNGNYVLIEGKFNKDITGHMEMNSGAVEGVSRYQNWER